MNYEKRLSELLIELPEIAQPVKATVPSILAGKLLYIGGQLPYSEGKIAFKGRLGLEISLDQGHLASRYALLQALSVIRQTLGSLNKVQKIVQLAGFVASGGDFKDHDRVLDSASNLLQDIFGSAGKHTRIAVGVHTLPLGACVELSLIVEVK